MSEKRLTVSFEDLSKPLQIKMSGDTQELGAFVGGNYIGTSDKFFIFTQGMPDSVWTIEHTLNKKPSVTVVDTRDSIVHGNVEYISNTKIIITFSAAFAGKAYLN